MKQWPAPASKRVRNSRYQPGNTSGCDLTIPSVVIDNDSFPSTKTPGGKPEATFLGFDNIVCMELRDTHTPGGLSGRYQALRARQSTDRDQNPVPYPHQHPMPEPVGHVRKARSADMSQFYRRRRPQWQHATLAHDAKTM